MRKAIRQKIKELQNKMDEICPEGKSLFDVGTFNINKVKAFYKYQYAQNILKDLIGEY